MKGAMLNTGFRFFTDLNKLLQPFREVVVQYNWLISNYECNGYPDHRLPGDASYAWLSGQELLQITDAHYIQFIFAVLSAIPPAISLEEVLQYDLPYADEYRGFWKNPITIQHPLAEIEVVPWDAILVLFISKKDELVEEFRKQFPMSIDLEKYNDEP